MEKITKVYLHSAPEDNDLVSGRFPPQRVRNESTDSVNMIIRSEDRNFGNDFDFQVDLLTSSTHIRKIQLAKCMLPLLPQINSKNKSITITHADGTVTFDLIEGYYSVQAMVNMMQSEFLNAWISLDPTNLVTVNYNIERREISITDDNGENWYIHSGCPFDLYARNVVKFPTLPSGSLPVTNEYKSNSLGMIYSRYVIVTSNRLTEDQKSYSILSNIGPKNVVAVLDLSSKYTEAQFAVTSSFPGTDVVIDSLEYAPKINLLNRNKALKIVDIQLIDEFGFNLNELNTPSYTFVYPVAMWFQCSL